MQNSTQFKSTQYILQEARDIVRLALQKVRSGNITLATLNTIEDLCARTELKITRAIKDVENEREARETATALLTSHTTTTQPTS